MKKILLMFVLEKDKRFVKIPPGVDTKIIGQRAKYLSNSKDDLAGYDHVILFGSCGLLDDRLRSCYLYMPMIGHWYDGLPCVELISAFTSDHVVKSSDEKYRLFSEGDSIVDMEDGMIEVLCDFGDIPLSVIRFPLDYCDRPLKRLRGYRGLYRIYQQYMMQRKFSRVLPLLIDKINQEL